MRAEIKKEPGILHLVLKKKWFDRIAAGTKTEEYRLIKPHWIKRLVGKEFTGIVFQMGYATDAPRLTANYTGYDIGVYKSDEFGEEEVAVFILTFDNVNRV